VLFSGVTDVPRIKELQEIAAEAQEKMKAVATEKDAEKKHIETNDVVKPLF
jgi:uncharacterized membrane protein (DUF106 family)